LNIRPIDQRLKELEALCREHNTPCTLQRRLVLETVLGRRDHPSADQVYEDVAGRSPGISRATVHRTLDFLVSLGLVSRACHPGHVARFDAITENHHHLVCMHCDQMIDFEDCDLPELKLPDASDSGFEVTGYRVQFRGICRECRERAGSTI